MNNTIKETIERLIEQEDNAVERGRLLVMLQISNVISDLYEKNKDLETHVKHAGDYINNHRRATDRFAGAKKLGIALFFVVQSVGGYFAYNLIDVPKKLTADLVALERRVFITESAIRANKDLILP